MSGLERDAQYGICSVCNNRRIITGHMSSIDSIDGHPEENYNGVQLCSECCRAMIFDALMEDDLFVQNFEDVGVQPEEGLHPLAGPHNNHDLF